MQQATQAQRLSDHKTTQEQELNRAFGSNQAGPDLKKELMLLRKAVLRIEQYKAAGQEVPTSLKIFYQYQMKLMKPYLNVVAPER